MAPTTAATWEPAAPNPFWNYLGRTLALPTYPCVFPFAVLSRCDATVDNAKWWRACFPTLGLVVGSVAHGLVSRNFSTTRAQLLGHLGVFFTMDHAFIWFTLIAHHIMEIYSIDRKAFRLNDGGGLHGPKVIVIGNGPSAMEGEQRGDDIDKYDEVVRFNNFQTKAASLGKYVGTKTTVHFSDGVLYPTYKDYHAPGASVVLSLIMDRFMVTGTYVILRMAENLECRLALNFLKDPNVSWISKDAIERLKEKLGLAYVKHPTSGMLAIDHFVRMEGVQLPIVIHGFDFFMGPKMHYFDEYEPLWERMNDKIGVNQHSPHLEKVYVEKLIAEGKVVFLKDVKP